MNKMRNIYVFFSLSLLFLFAGCALMLVYTQIEGYQNLRQEIENDFDTYTPFSYLANKIHSYDETSAISSIQIEGISCLRLQDEQTDTLIYVQDGKLKELYTIQGTAFDLEAGEELMDCEHLEIHLKPHFIELEVNDQKLQIRLHSEANV